MAAVIVEQGKILDFIDRTTQRPETPEEYVRQEIAKSLVREYLYSREYIAVEYTLRLGSRRPRADLVIFSDSKKHTQDRAQIILECKAPTVKADDRNDGVGQLQSYMAACPNARYGMWTNGTDRYCYAKVETRGEVSFEEIADIPAFGSTIEDAEKPTFDKLKPASSDALLFAFRRCHNYIAGNQGLQKPEAFWELLKLIFCKIHDERESQSVKFYATSAERRNLNGEMKVRARIEKLFDSVKKDYPQIFKTGEEIELTPAVLAYIVSQLQIYALLESDVDVKGKAYEEIVGSNLRGDRGEFFTPRNVCRMVVNMLDPNDRQLILDPACGTGGFLITAMNHVIAAIRVQELAKWKGQARAETAISQRNDRFLSHKLIGMDFNPNLVKAAKMNMVMNNDGEGGLYQADSLASPATWVAGLRELSLMNSVDLLMTNPPFGSKIPVDNPTVLEAYELGHQWNYDEADDRWVMLETIQRSQPPEILFIERCLRFLKPGSGVAAMVLPDGILGSPGLGYVRQWLMDNAYILASIDMHPDTFQPGTSVQTSILVFQRKTETQKKIDAAGKPTEYEVFMALANHIGHDKRGNTLYLRDKDGNEIVEEVELPVREYIDGVPVLKNQKTMRKMVDDNTGTVATEFRKWVTQAS
ncbi:N-6 DNA methylase [Mycobacterium vicinigordonae]|uniref:N-6 DNA methylase n=1 Tax=Mycobacterium vicinigordonae TaxID=1719132 RepID=A0A7D6E4B0_9MYCO|nr:N-6 DNA methylase [Mycobacterium vicinigordonae]